MTDQPTSEAAQPDAQTGPGERPAPHDLMWYERPDMGKMLAVGLLAAGIALVVMGFFFHGDSAIALKKVPGFYALSAIASVVAAALAARILRGLFHVGEDYYDR